MIATFINSYLLFFFFSVVPLLSAISGWLFFVFLGYPEADVLQSLGKRIQKRVSSLYLPLVAWNTFYLALLMVVFATTPDHPLLHSLNIDFGTASWWRFVNAVFAIDHHPIAFQFWFVRDLFVTVLVSAQGQLVINRLPVPFISVEALGDVLRKTAAPMKEPVVIISADANATHQAVIRVMEAARIAGLSQITFTTQSTK